MKKTILNIALILGSVLCANAKTYTDSIESTYRRSSICSFMVSRTDQKMFDKIQTRFLEIPTPDQYNEHNLSIRILNVDKKGEYASDIDQWLADNLVASRLVAKWFERDVLTGDCSFDLVKQRGLYSSTEFDRELASRSVRGKAMLEDAGEELIGNTFVLVHEVHYIDNAKRSQNVATGLRIFGALTALAGIDLSDTFDSFADLAQTFKGFRVKFHTRLYQLEWNDEISNTFYREMWGAKNKDAFNRNRGKFTLKFIGEVESSGSQNSFLGISEEHPELMIRKACQRAIDDNVRDLQRGYEVFRVKSPIAEVTDDAVMVPIGMKEGITKDSEYEVLEPEEKDGHMIYKRIGVIVPIENRIMDNRYMAFEEGAVGSELKYTAFKVKSGKTPMAGHLVRQIK